MSRRSLFPWIRSLCLLGTVLALMLMPALATHATPPPLTHVPKTHAVTSVCGGIFAGWPVGTSKNVSIQSASNQRYLQRVPNGDHTSIEAAGTSLGPANIFKATRITNLLYSFQTTDVSPPTYFSRVYRDTTNYLEADKPTIDPHTQFSVTCSPITEDYAMIQADDASWLTTPTAAGAVMTFMANAPDPEPVSFLIVDTQVAKNLCPLLQFPIGTSRKVSIQSVSKNYYLTRVHNTSGRDHQSIETTSRSVVPASTFKLTHEASGLYSFQTTDISPPTYFAPFYSYGTTWLEANQTSLDDNATFSAVCDPNTGNYAFQSPNLQKWFTSSNGPEGFDAGVIFREATSSNYPRRQFLIAGVC